MANYLAYLSLMLLVAQLSYGQDVCPPLPAPENGSVDQPSPIRASSRAIFTCNEGFSAGGTSIVRFCRSAGIWTGIDTVCSIVDCGPLDSPANGDVMVTTTTFTSTANYSCVSGYELDGNSTRTCQASGLWSGDEPACNSVDCGPLDPPANGNVMVTMTTFSSRANYSCVSGYELDGNSTRTCQASRLWSGNEPACNSVDCGPLSPPANGDVMVTTTTFTSTANYSCVSGYELDGNSTRTCQASRLWSGDEPACNPVDCGPLSPPANGDVMVTTTTFTSTANYSCVSGPELDGNSTRTCQASGLWSGDEPACNPIDCGPPPPLTNGGADFTTTTVNSFATYSCNEGFDTIVVTSTISFCQPDGLWSEAVLTCQIITCNRLFDPINGVVTFSDDFNFDSEAMYSCIPGFEIVGMESRFCQATGQWNGTAPTCQRIDCGPPSDVTNGEVIFGLTTFNSLAGYSCDDGFQLIPSSQNLRTCTADRVWSGPDPRCGFVDCGSPSVPTNGAVEYNTTTYTSTANYTCEFGYELRPSAATVRVCEEDGLWTGPDPTCELLIQCNELTSPSNGQVTITSASTQLPRTMRSTALYECESGYQLVGNDARVCENDGETGSWSGEEPTCEDVDECLLGTDNCAQLCSNSVGSFQCSCTEGFTLDNDGFNCNDIDECSLDMDDCHSNASCTNTEGGFNCSCLPGFEGNGTFCLIDCGVLPPLTNGAITYSPNTLDGGVAIHSCDEGFIVQGGEQRTCLPSGLWELVSISCLQVVHIEFEPAEYTVSETETGVFLGVEKRNSTDRTITVFFSTRPGTAEAPRDYIDRTNLQITFAPSAFRNFVSVSIIDGATFRGNVTLFGVLTTNDPGVVVGPDAIVLIIDDEPPNDQCVSLDSPTNGTVLLNGTQIGDTVSYECDPGFNLVGDVNRTCNSVGLWTGRDPTCEIADCGSLPNPPNGQVSFTSTTYLSTATYTCNQNFRLEGVVSRECTAEGVWSLEEPDCVDIFAVCSLCSPQAECVQIGPLQYGCQCRGGFLGDGMTCVDVDECLNGDNNCHEDADCFNSPGGFSCRCRPGYRGTGANCQNIDECSEGSHNCHQRAICTDTEGSFTCSCRPGFEGDGFDCVAPPCSSNFQLVLEDFTACTTYISIDADEKISDITDGVLNVVNRDCAGECQLLSSQIKNSELTCTTTNVAAFRGTIDVTNGENCTQLVEILSNWVSSGPSLRILSVRTQVATYCEIEFDSFDVRIDCVDPLDNGTRPTIDSQATDAPPSGNTIQLTMAEIIAVSAVGGGVGLLLIVTVLVICCVFAVRISRIRGKVPDRLVEGASSGNDALSFQETSSQRRRRTKPTYDPDLIRGDVEFSTFSNAGAPPLQTSYIQMPTSNAQGFQADTIMHNEGVVDLEFPN